MILSVFILLIALSLLTTTRSQEGVNKSEESNVTNSSTLYFPYLRTDKGWETNINIANLDGKIVDVKLFSNGSSRRSVKEASNTISLNMRETKSIETEKLLPGSQSLRIDSNGNISGTALIETVDGKKLESIPAIKEPSTQLDFPTLADGDISFKDITLLNIDSSPIDIKVIALDAHGRLIDNKTLSALPQGDSITFNSRDLFSSQSLNSISTIEVISDEPIVGVQLVDLPEGDLVGLPALTTTSKGGSFPITTKGGDLELWTTVGILNPGNIPTSVTVEAFDASEKSLGVVENVTLPSGVTHFMTSENMKGIIPIKTAALKVTSDRPISGYEVIGVVDGNGLTVVLGIPKENQTGADFEIVGSKDGSVLNTSSVTRMKDGTTLSAFGDVGLGYWSKVVSHTQAIFELSITISAGTSSPSISVISPNGGEVWAVGSTQTISWTSSNLNPAGSIFIYYLYNNGWQRIAGPLSATTTSFSWTIPNIPTTSSRIFLGNSINNRWEITDQSDQTFTIANIKPSWYPSEEGSRKPFELYYQTGIIPSHSPYQSDDLGLKWELPLRSNEVPEGKIIDLGGAFCPTLIGHQNGGWRERYLGIHRGHDLGISRSRLKGRKIPVHVISDGIYDGQRTYNIDEHLTLECRPLVVYHLPNNSSNKIYTSIYCHVDPNPELKIGQKLKAGDIIGTLEYPKGGWNAHVHLELYTRPVYFSKDSTKRSRCGCSSDSDCDLKTKIRKAILRGCGIFEDDLYLLEPILFINKGIAPPPQ